VELKQAGRYIVVNVCQVLIFNEEQRVPLLFLFSLLLLLLYCFVLLLFVVVVVLEFTIMLKYRWQLTQLTQSTS